MGFWDTVGKIGKGVVDHVNEKAQKIQEYKRNYETYSDEQLMRIVKDSSAWGSSTEQKYAAAQVLKERRGE